MEKGERDMRAMRAEQFSGYEALKLVELPKPTVTDGKSTGANHGSRRHAARPYDSHPAISTSRRGRSSWATKERAWWRREAERIFLPAHA